MTREYLLEMALKVAVETIQKTSKKHNTYPLVLTSLEAIVGKTQNAQDIALVQYRAEHPEA